LQISDCRLATAVIAGALTLAGCAAPEQPLLEQFFGASRLRDTTALQTVATVIFEPLEQGIVRTFRITGVTVERADGQTRTKDVTVEAPVILPDGHTVQKTLVVTLQQSTGDNPGRWMVTAIREVAQPPSAPRP
jgi:uncharacterized lipoprotein YmbA